MGDSQAVGAHSKELQKQIDRHAGGNRYERTYDEVVEEFEKVDPESIGAACIAWKATAEALGHLAEQLRPKAGDPLSAAWVDEAAKGAQEQLRLVQATAQALADQSMKMAHAMDYTAQYATWYKHNIPDRFELTGKSAGVGAISPVVGAFMAADEGSKQAVQHMTNFLSRYNEVIGNLLPAEVKAQLLQPATEEEIVWGDPPTSSGSGGSHGAGVGGLGTGAGGHGGAGLSAGAGKGIGDVGLPSSGSGLVPSLGGGTGGVGGLDGLDDPYAAGSELAGGGSGGGIGGGIGGTVAGGGALGAGLEGVGGGLAGGIGGGLSGGVGGAGGGLAGGVGAGSGGIGGGVMGAGGVGAGGRIGGSGGGLSGASGGAGGGLSGARGAGSGGLGGGGVAGEGAGGRGVAPMGGGQGGRDNDVERSTWLEEDDDIWGGSSGAAPPVIDH